MSKTPLRASARRAVTAAGPIPDLLRVVLAHLCFTAAIACTFVLYYHRRKVTAVSHLVLVTEWVALLLIALALLGRMTRTRRRAALRHAFTLLPAAALTLQLYLYILDFFSNSFWAHNITLQLLASYAPSVVSGKEPMPVGRTGIGLAALAVLATSVVICSRVSGRLRRGLEALLAAADSRARLGCWRRPALPVALAVASASLFASMSWGIRSDWALWQTEMITNFFRPDVVIFEPTPRRNAIADWDDRLRAHYPRQVPGARRKNVILIIVDSLRADHMQVYGYRRPTTPFLASLLTSGRLKKVAMALSTCSESYCGITSTLSSREFRDISARDFKLQDVLARVGYQTWFILSGNHLAWYNLGEFYGERSTLIFDGSKSHRYAIDDDRAVLEGLRHVPDAGAAPAFFYFHLMSTHYAGIQLPAYRTWGRPGDEVPRITDLHEILNVIDTPDRYDDKVLQADDFIRQIFAALKSKGYLDNAIAVITGDHGEGLGERHYGHGWYLYQEDIHIPLLLYDDASVPYANLDLATQVDIAPTILDRLGLPVPGSWEGRSLLAPGTERYSFHQTYFEPVLYALVNRGEDGLFKYIDCPATGAEQLFDLRGDPGERRNLIAAADPELVRRLRGKLAVYRAQQATVPAAPVAAGRERP